MDGCERRLAVRWRRAAAHSGTGRRGSPELLEIELLASQLDMINTKMKIRSL
jgi:hypothetical protein